jgi:predicted  nucleic acid-binding Zn-ribbon protein
MMRHWPSVVALFAGLVLGVALDNRGTVRRTEAKDSGRPQDAEIAALKAEIQAIKDRLPDQAHAMQDVANQFTNVWFAREQQHWDLANFYLGETRNHLRWAVRIIPKRKDANGQNVDLVAILQAFENGPLKQLDAVIKSKNDVGFVAAYKFTLESCYACHKAASKPYLRPRIPIGPATQIISFAPNANWPL